MAPLFLFVAAAYMINHASGFQTHFSSKQSTRVKTFFNVVENPKDYDVQRRDDLFSTLVSRFQGDFDNYHQVVQDRKMGLAPRQGGGHEHFHVTFIPMPIDLIPEETFPMEEHDDISAIAIVASYYFDGMPDRIFRLRMYIIYCDDDDEHREQTVLMRLYNFCPTLEKSLRQNSDNALENWIKIITDYVYENGSDSFKELNRCDIEWTKNPDEFRHAYLNKFSSMLSKKGKESVPIHAKMIYDHDQGGVILESQMMPGTFIRIQDELSLWQDELWINDRGFDANTKNMVYGNWKGIPYQMMRVANVEQDDTNNIPGQYRRTVVASDLSWTLGEKWRTMQEYEMKMTAIGGKTSRMNSK